MRIAQYVRNPRAALHRVERLIYERRHPDEPWIAPGAIRFLEENLRPDMRALEWGSGRSTAWLAARVGHLTSIEHDAAWYARVRTQLADRGAQVDYKLTPLDPEKDSGNIYGPNDAPAYVAVAASIPEGSLDLVSVDGAYRVSCVVAATAKLRPGGWLMVDDTTWFPMLFDGYIPADWPIVFRPRRTISSTVIWRKPQ